MADTINVAITAASPTKGNITKVEIFDNSGSKWTYLDGTGWSGAPQINLGTDFTVRTYVKNEGATGVITVTFRNITGSATLATFNPTINSGVTGVIDYIHYGLAGNFSLGIYASP